ncbi:MAG: cytochrome c biogenesis protein CcsA [Candidatus Nanopelagicales bacterium]
MASQPTQRHVPWLGALSALMLIVFLTMCFFYAPEDSIQGQVQRLFYPHVASAWVAGLAFFTVFVASIGYLVTRDLKWDGIAAASAEVGLLFTSGTLILGMLWGKASWGTYWAWDPRLTSVLVLWLLYLAYLALRTYVSEPAKRARFSSVLGIVAFVDVPIIYFSIKWWRTQHPSYVIQPGMKPAMPAEMLQTLLFGVATFTVLYIYLASQRLRLLRYQAQEVAR